MLRNLGAEAKGKNAGKQQHPRMYGARAAHRDKGHQPEDQEVSRGVKTAASMQHALVRFRKHSQ